MALLLLREVLLACLLGLFDGDAVAKLFIVGSVWVLLVVMLPQVVLALEEFGTVVTLHGGVAGLSVFWNLNKVLIGRKCSLLHLILLFQVVDADGAGDHDLIGVAETTLSAIMRDRNKVFEAILLIPNKSEPRG